MELLEINGAHGEGGGQIVRSAITLSCITNKPIHIENIRKGRSASGLKPQHIAAISILQKVSNAEVTGATKGSTELRFVPGKIKSSQLEIDIGTAGSITLVLQVIVPAVALSQKEIRLTLKGGTDVLWAPTLDYTLYVLREAYLRMGVEFSSRLVKRGYYPKGGGEIQLQVKPSKANPISFAKRETRKAKLTCTYSKLSEDIIQNEIKGIEERLSAKNFAVESQIVSEEALDSGASLLVYSIDEQSIIGVDALFDAKLQKFPVNLARFVDALGVDENLADMLIVPASLANERVTFQIKNMTEHLKTNLFVTSKITGCRYGIGRLDGGYEVVIEGVSDSGIK